MAINNLSAQYNGGFLLDMILFVDPMLLPSGNPIKCHEEVLSSQPIITKSYLNILTFSP